MESLSCYVGMFEQFTDSQQWESIPVIGLTRRYPTRPSIVRQILGISFTFPQTRQKNDPLRHSRDRDIVRNGLPLGQGAADTEENFSPSQHSQKVEIEAIQQALEETSWNKSAETKVGHVLPRPTQEAWA